MSVKIKISYQTAQELDTVLKLLKPMIKSCKTEKGSDRPYKRAYIEIK